MDAKDLLVHSPQVISNTTPCMYDLRLLRHQALDRLPARVLGGPGAFGSWARSIMGLPAANHAGHTCWPDAARATGMLRYGAILVGKNPIEHKLPRAPACLGDREACLGGSGAVERFTCLLLWGVHPQSVV